MLKINFAGTLFRSFLHLVNSKYTVKISMFPVYAWCFSYFMLFNECFYFPCLAIVPGFFKKFFIKVLIQVLLVALTYNSHMMIISVSCVNMNLLKYDLTFVKIIWLSNDDHAITIWKLKHMINISCSIYMKIIWLTFTSTFNGPWPQRGSAFSYLVLSVILACMARSLAGGI